MKKVRLLIMSKQSKQYESMRQTQANTFSDGLNMDLHPLTTPNTILTDCVNGTMITYNDNEFVLQNERGNNKIKIGDNDHVKLSEGFIPVGMKEHNGILYIISHNPQTKQSEIGTFPSPANITNFIDNNFEKTVEIEGKTIIYSGFESKVNYYDPDLIVSNFDKYQLNQVYTENPLLVLEHFILTKNGEMQKLDLKDDNTIHRFNHVGEGLLGYKYRPFSIDSFNAYITPIQNANNAKLFVDFTTTDNELINNYKNIDIQCDVHVFLGDEQFARKPSITFENFEEFHNLQGNGYLTLDFTNDISTDNCSYDQKKGVIIYNGIEYSDLKFKIELYLYKDGYNLFMNHLTKTIEIKVSEVVQPLQTFSVFKYKKNESNKLDILIKLDMAKYNPNYTINSIYDIGEASYKLIKIDKNGNLEGKIVANSKFLLGGQISYPIVASAAEVNNYELTLAKDEGDDNAFYCFKPSTMIEKSTILPAISISYNNTCNHIYEVGNATKVKYLKVDEQYNIVWLNDKDEVVSTTVYVPCESDTDMVDERWEDPNTLKYEINDVEYDPNSVYLLQLTYPINNDNNIASFIVVTTDKMLTNEHYELDRMDLLGIEDWYDANISISDIIIHDAINTQNNTYYDSNILHTIEEINNSDDILKLVERKFLKYQQVLDVTLMKEEIPKLGYSYDFEISFNNEDKANFDVEISFNNKNKINNNVYRDTLFYTYTLNPIYDEPYEQNWERKYVYDDLKDYSFYTQTVKINEAYKLDEYSEWQDIMYSFDNPYKKYGKILGTWNSKTIPSEDSFLLGEGTIYRRNIGFYANRLQGGCGNAKRKYEGYYTLDDIANRASNNFGLTLDCGTIQIMKELNFGNYFHYGKVKNFGKKDRVAYNGELEKIWTRYKKNNKYVLVGLNLNQETPENCKNILDALLHHMYYLRYDPKTVIQYKFATLADNEESTNDIVVSEINNLSKTVDISYIITPTQCKIVNNNLINYNIQSWNNVSTKFIIKNYSKTIKIETPNMEKVHTYLQYLGLLLNVNQIPKNEKLSSDDSNLLYYDFDETLLNSDLNSKSISHEKLPQLFYDESRKLTYLDIVTEDKDYFEYIGEKGCVPNFNWNYKDTFDFKLTNIDDLLSYHSLQFYKLTNYESE